MLTRKVARMRSWFKMRRKAFIGPLGDDIPSIFPIVLGVVLFMATITYANGAYNARNEELTLRKTALALSYAVTEKGVFSIDEFTALCEKSLVPYATHSGTKFAVVLKRHCGKVNLFNSNPFYSNFHGEGADNVGLCTNMDFSEDVRERAWAAVNSSDFEAAQPYFPSDAVVLNYPIAVACPEENSATNGVGMVNVIVWKR